MHAMVSNINAYKCVFNSNSQLSEIKRNPEDGMQGII